MEGRDIRFEYRQAQGRAERLPQLAKELVALKADVFVLGSEEALRAAQLATSAIPIVMIFLGDDPVAAGLVDSLNRPGGNVTGVAVGCPRRSKSDPACRPNSDPGLVPTA
ncbi:MAG: ABC transporter substrate binding protein [Acidimicrobiales bacterium]